MPETETANFGPIFYAPESVFEFPNGLPGFEERHQIPAGSEPTANGSHRVPAEPG